MSHTIRDKSKIVARVRRIRGQMDAVERALEAETPCGEVLQLLASVRGAMSGLTAELMEDHMREHVLEASSDNDRQKAAEELLGVIRTYMK